MATWVTGRIEENIHWTDELFSLRVRAPVEPYTAGQFTQLGLEIDGEIIGRPYSYVSAPQDALLEFCLVTVPEGPLTNRLVAMHPGDSLLVRPKPAGFFVLKEVPEGSDLWLLATGTAIGPFISILRTAEPWQRFENIVLAHAVRHAAELTYTDSIAALSRSHPGQLHYQPFVTRENHPGALRQRIPAALRDRSIERQLGLQLDAGHSQVMLCGNPGMVKDSCTVLGERGLQRNRRRAPGQVTTENYW